MSEVYVVHKNGVPEATFVDEELARLYADKIEGEVTPTPMDPRRPENAEGLRSLLDTHDEVMIVCATFMPGVIIPRHLRANPTAGFRLGWNMTPPISDLEITESHIYATLSFGGEPFRCEIPLVAIVTTDPDLYQEEEPEEPERPNHLRLV